MVVMTRGILLAALVFALSTGAVEAVDPIVLDTSEIEELLATAEIVELEEFDSKGVTEPRRAVLSNGDVTIRAAFKDVDLLITEAQTHDGRRYYNIRDSYRHEIAAYKLDTLLGFGLVPPTVERRIGQDTGSLQAWVEGAMTEWERKHELKLTPPDADAWNRQVATTQLFLQLIWDTDYANISNILVDPGWRVWKIDSSRAFHVNARLRKSEKLASFPRGPLAAIRGLDRRSLERELTPWLDRNEIKTLWRRCGRVVDLADQRIAEHGEAAVLFDWNGIRDWSVSAAAEEPGPEEEIEQGHERRHRGRNIGERRRVEHTVDALPLGPGDDAVLDEQCFGPPRGVELHWQRHDLEHQDRRKQHGAHQHNVR
jgi:hypothetical protein